LFSQGQCGESGEMFGVIYEQKDRSVFQTSKIEVGGEYLIIRPALIGDWSGMAMLKTSQPLLKTQGVFDIQHFFPETLPEHVCQTIYSIKLLKLAHSVCALEFFFSRKLGNSIRSTLA
jgi:hypothetical protein